jgi:2-methylcitrate dehydratase PrpD
MMSGINAAIAERVGEFVLRADASRIPGEVRHFASLLLLDTLGVAAAANAFTPARIARDIAAKLYAAGSHGPSAAMLFDGRRVSVPGAVFGAAAQLDNLDAHDGLNATKGHIGVVVVPALMAFAQTVPPLTGPEALAALVIGYEVGARGGMALHMTVSDYHSSGAWNALAVAALGIRLRKASKSQLREALGIAEYHGPRSQMMRVIDHPTMLHDGSAWGALAGSSAVFLAEAGYTGAPAITVEGEDAARLWDDLGKDFMVGRHYIKPYPICRWVHPLIDGALELRFRNDFTHDDIASIELTTFHEATRLFRGMPNTSEVAQYAIAFPVAAALVNGRVGVDELSETSFGDARIAKLVALISIQESADYNQNFPTRRLGDLTLELTDGRRLRSGTLNARGGPENPLSETDIVAKYRGYAIPALGEKRARALEAAVRGLTDERTEFSPVLELTLGALGSVAER